MTDQSKVLVLDLVYCSNQRQTFSLFVALTCVIGVTAVRPPRIDCGSMTTAPKVVVAIILSIGIAEIRS